MRSRGTPPQSAAQPGQRASDRPSISPVLPLLLLETMRELDRPEELLEDEDISTSLPRRLGLSEVVRVQIRRFEEEVRQRRPQIPSQVEDLLRLVIRRPDAEKIFIEAGRRVARRFWTERSAGLRRIVPILPRQIALLVAERAGRKMFAHLVGPSRFSISRRPVSLRIEGSLTARADPGGDACGLYAGAFAQLLELYTGRQYRVRHPRCATRGSEDSCLWEVEISG